MFRNIIIAGLILLLPGMVLSQTIYLYPLKADFSSVQAGGPDLIQIPNNNGQTGEFVTRNVPPTTCGQSGTAGGYFFEDDAGFQFNNPAGFIDQAYSLAFNFQIDEFITPPPWVRLLSFTHIDDVGIYIKLTNPPDYGTLEFWPYGTVGQDDFFSPDDFYQLILVRNSSGMIKIYINGQEFAEYDDSGTMKYLPQPPDNFIVFFRDHPSVLADEASPGFVSALRITNVAWTSSEVEAIWEEFCSSLLDIGEPVAAHLGIGPNPAREHISLYGEPSGTFEDYVIYDLLGNKLVNGCVLLDGGTIDVRGLNKGMYILQLRSGNEVRSFKFMKE